MPVADALRVRADGPAEPASVIVSSAWERDLASWTDLMPGGTPQTPRRLDHLRMTTLNRLPSGWLTERCA
ncbi:hypothetical protein TPA0907_46700 [Micromonospora humidisoli]|nr:hypothetical protein TPA0907_46700 [Micromonospora sp. AKA109]